MNQIKLLIMLGFLANGMICRPYENNVLNDIRRNLGDDISNSLKNLDPTMIDQWKAVLNNMNEHDAKNLVKGYLREAMSEPVKRKLVDKIAEEGSQAEEDMQNYLNQILKREVKSNNFDSVLSKLNDLEMGEDIVQLSQKEVTFNPEERDVRREQADGSWDKRADAFIPFKPEEREVMERGDPIQFVDDSLEKRQAGFVPFKPEERSMSEREEPIQLEDGSWEKRQAGFVPFKPEERDFIDWINPFERDVRREQADGSWDKRADDFVPFKPEEREVIEREVKIPKMNLDHLELIAGKGEPMIHKLQKLAYEAEEQSKEIIKKNKIVPDEVLAERKGDPLSVEEQNWNKQIQAKREAFSPAILNTFLNEWTDNKRSVSLEKMDKDSLKVSKKFLQKLIGDFVRLKGLDKQN